MRPPPHQTISASHGRHPYVPQQQRMRAAEENAGNATARQATAAPARCGRFEMSRDAQSDSRMPQADLSPPLEVAVRGL